MMHGREKSDPAIVARKPANNAGQPAAERVERRAGTEGNAGQQNTRRAQDRESVSQALERVRQAAKQRRKERFTALFHHINPAMLRTAFFALKRDAAAGVDGVGGRTTKPISIARSKICAIGSIGGHIGRSPRGVGIFRSPMGGSVRSQSQPWKTRLSNGQQLRCRMRSTRRNSSGSAMDSARAAASTMRWTRSVSGSTAER